MAHRCGGRTLAVCGMLRDKDVAGTLRSLLDLVDHWYLGAVDSSRAASAQALEQTLRALSGGVPAVVAATIAEAYRGAREDARRGDRIVVFGSFYAVAGALYSADVNQPKSA
jgi:dihydrofolate synthase/folylpolyglutamate synthase